MGSERRRSYDAGAHAAVHLTVWTRLHGVISLEIASHLDPALPYGRLV
jgi:hypothetical protein